MRQVEALSIGCSTVYLFIQEILRPVLLRRMKEDVETLPEKEEVIIWVELTRSQRSYYKALYENQIKSLLSHSKNTELPNLRNLAMELRKVCCHPVRVWHNVHLAPFAGLGSHIHESGSLPCNSFIL